MMVFIREISFWIAVLSGVSEHTNLLSNQTECLVALIVVQKKSKEKAS